MKLSELINQLQISLNTSGDKTVYIDKILDTPWACIVDSINETEEDGNKSLFICSRVE
jgi:hypothetical protein